ncbi:MAG: histidinol phosphate phosphatase domain-containing protein [Nitrospirae bacterium]|nr:histidinol phosphate phosphatase domain-containing protein [Nitrospirota bacterium]
MIDLHTHSLMSDGELLPSELVQRAYCLGYEAIAITDHVDLSNIDLVVPKIAEAIKGMERHFKIKIIPGAEITHVPPPLIKDLVLKARSLGAKLVVVHGESIVEPVAPGTNRAAIEAGADILAHPGHISRDDAIMARDNGVALELTSRKGHCLSNGHVASIARECGATIIINTDAHGPQDLITKDWARAILLSSGIKPRDVEGVFENSKNLVNKILARS